MSELERLLALADALAKGRGGDDSAAGVDPGDRDAGPTSPRDLERLVAALRRIDQTTPETETPRAAPTGAEDSFPERWAHLHLLSTIAAGPTGTVYRAHDTRLGVDVALKLLGATMDRQQRDRLMEDGRLLARLRHPHVVRCYGSDESDGFAGIWMELIRGCTLEDWMQEGATCGAHDAALIGRDLCHAAAAIHQAGVPYRGIAAGNVMRDTAGRIVLMAPTSGRAIGEAEVVNSLSALLRRLLSDGTRGLDANVDRELASVIARSSAEGQGHPLDTLEALETELVRVASGTAPPQTVAPAARPGSPRHWWTTLARAFRRDQR